MTALFESSVVSSNPEYVALRDHPRNAALREIASQLWLSFAPYADPSFPQLFADQLHPRFWEMYLAVRLLEKGLKLIPKSASRGPDIHAIFSGNDLWIEAVAPEEGEGPDAVPSLEEHESYEPYPEDKIILRFTN